MRKNDVDNGPMFNAYPDSMGGTLSDIVSFLKYPEFQDVFQSFYILPSIFHSDLDRGFCIIDYDLETSYATEKDLDELKRMGLHLKLDFVLNHLSVQSKQFQDLLERGSQSEYKEFFIDWNKFWDGCGEMTQDGYIQPCKEMLADMFFRKPGLPILMVEFPDGRRIPYWNTFYQEIRRQEDQVTYLGQMDLNVTSPLVWEYYEETLKKLAGYGAGIVRLDAFAYASKSPGKKNFLNEPDTWEILERIKTIAGKYHLTLLPEIHAKYSEKIYEKLSGMGYMTYDFFLPGLILDGIEHKNARRLAAWAQELQEKGIRTVNMLGCHDGIPLLDLKGLLSEEEIGELTAILIDRGGYVKNLHGQKNMYYQVNTTYFSALGEDEKKMLLARAIQLFMPGKPQVWYLDLFAGKNDYKAVKQAGKDGHKEINRTNLKCADIDSALNTNITQQQLKMLHFRNTCRAFGFGAHLSISTGWQSAEFIWENRNIRAVLDIDFSQYHFRISEIDEQGRTIRVL